MKKPLILCGAAGVGKGTICSHLVSPKGSLFATTVSCTTRAPRPEEGDGKHYWFVNDEQFSESVQRGEFIEFAEVHKFRYGTLYSELDRLARTNKAPVIEIDVQGALQLAGKIDAVFIFLRPPSMDELERRLRGRGTDSEEQILHRLSVARSEQRMASPPTFRHVVNGACTFETTARIVRLWREHANNIP